MFLPTQPYKGSRDFYPEDKRIQNWIFSKVRSVLQGFAYQEYDGPLLESFELYAAKSGEEIVNAQLYSFVDRGDRKVAIRPEMTPTLARMVAGKLQELPKPIRWFSIPNVWRYERPQKGRLREHWQVNADVLGGDSLLADAEILTLAVKIFAAFDGLAHFKIKINHRGLVNHVFHNELGLEPERALKLSKLVDAKDKLKPELFASALATDVGLDSSAVAKLEKFFGLGIWELEKTFPCQASSELLRLYSILKDRGLEGQIEFSPTIMRGLDYYTGLVFEAFDSSPENNRALFGGGRYDNLIGLFGKNQLSGIGFGLGDVTLRNFLETHKLLPSFGAFADVFVCAQDLETLSAASEVAAALRLTGLRVVENLDLDGFSAQLKMAAKQGVPFFVFVGAKEVAAKNYGVKDLRSGQQVEIAAAEMATHIHSKLS